MFGKLPELLNRNFAIGFFLPIATFGIVSLGLADIFGVFTAILTISNFNDLDTLIGTTVLLLISWLGGVFLLATNSDIRRILEGYGSLNPMRIFGYFERRYYNRLTTRIKELNQEHEKHKARGETLSDTLRDERIKLMHESAQRFPDAERWLRPTAFGNTVRAFEVYSRVMYGIDTTVGWDRLLAVIPTDYRALIEDAKTFVDFWANTWLLSLAVFLEYVVLVAYTDQQPMLWVPFASVLASAFALYRARTNAVEWGNLVKAAFDVYLPELQRKLEFALPPTKQEEVEMWMSFSRAALYRQQKNLPLRSPRPQNNQRDTLSTQPQALRARWLSSLAALIVGSFLIWLVKRLARSTCNSKTPINDHKLRRQK